MGLWPRPNNSQPPSEPPAKRISTPAGHRLSAVLGSDPHKNRNSLRGKNPPAVTIIEPRESTEGQSQNSSGYSYSVWSDGEKFAVFRNNKQITKRGGWKRILLILAIVIAAIIALAVGLAVGLKKRGSNASPVSQAPASAQASGTATPTSNNRPADPLPTPSSLSSTFPVGSYSMVTFLDTIQTNCTSNPLTWTCYPDTIYNTDPVKSVATFNWIISSPSKGKFQISSDGDNSFGISFNNVDLELLDAGNDKERYRFQLSQTKKVTPAQSILKDDNSKVECDFASTSLQAFLYTKMERSYPNPNKGEPNGNPKSPVWPFAVRIEQAVGGGQNVPSCHKLPNGDAITDGFTAQDASGLCSCLYRNWRTPSPYS